MAESLSPKTCSIDRLVTKPDDVAKIINGQKSAARRNGRYADPGEIMRFGEHSFKVTNVYQQTLGQISAADAIAEGYADVEAYKQSILSFHPGMRWLPEMKVWVHEFEPTT